MAEQQLRAVCFFDGQNLFHSAKAAFGYTFPNFDPLKLSKLVCRQQGWELVQARFYTGVPDAADKPFWHHFWTAKGAQMGREGVHLFTRPLVYRTKKIDLPDGTQHTFLDGDEKGIDVRLALDVISLANTRVYDVAVVFSRDQDLSEVAEEIRVISKLQARFIKIVTAYPYSPVVKSYRGVNKTDWLRIEKADYDTCIDTRDYRPKR
ncbi:MAG: NYN domain-containing protein [Devosia nanyangense]|uniref:NYN domain-containing protein n=1 Tax=Devosia nanyangense TaxID=1228055 RepID=A0A933NYY0_9HYPH|nr:NYN domain-containing protein [Devosia nanyangense]